MQANRRRFLSLLGIGAAGAPLAAKAATDAEIAKFAGLNGGGMLAKGISSDGYGPASVQGMGQISKGEWVSPYVQAHGYLKTFGKFPDFVEENIRARSLNVNMLDPDIACKKSWSMSVKIQEQRARNYQNQIEQYSVNGKHELAQSAFQKLTGFSWPW